MCFGVVDSSFFLMIAGGDVFYFNFSSEWYSSSPCTLFWVFGYQLWEETQHKESEECREI